MNGYEVVSVMDDKCIGHVSGRVGDFLIVEHGHLRKSQNPLPLSFATVDEANQRVMTTLAHDIVHDAPTAKEGEFDEQAAAQYYGLGDDTARVGGLVDEDDHERRRTRPVEPGGDPRPSWRRGDGETDTAGHRPAESPALLGDRQPRETTRPEFSRKPARERAATSVSRSVTSSSHVSVTWPMRLAYAPTRPSSARRATARRFTQRSQRMPVTWRMSVCSGTWPSVASARRARP